MSMTPRFAFGGKNAIQHEVEVGSLSRSSDPTGILLSSRERSTSGISRWFGSCSAPVPVIRVLSFLAVSCLVMAVCLGASRDARADGPVPPATDLPPVLSMSEALQIFRARGLDLLIAEAAVKSAE